MHVIHYCLFSDSYTWKVSRFMDVVNFLKRGTDVDGGKGLHERKSEKLLLKREIGDGVVSIAQAKGVCFASEEFGITETSVAKFIARAIKKNGNLSANMFMDKSKFELVKNHIVACNTTSVSRILSASSGDFSEAEIRIVKAQIEKNGVGNWDC